MVTWADMAAQRPAMAERGAALFLFGGAGGAYEGGLGYMATVRPDGGPRVHPLSPVLRGGDLFVFVLRETARARDLRGDSRYALHAWPKPFGVDDSFDDDTADVYRLSVEHAQHKSRPGGKLTYERWRASRQAKGSR